MSKANRKRGPKSKAGKKARSMKAGAKLSLITVRKSSSYGPSLYGLKIYHEGPRPKWLGKDGKFNFGKHILETLKNEFGRDFRLVITAENTDLVMKRGFHWVYIPQPVFKRIGSLYMARTRDIKLDIIRNTLATLFPATFSTNTPAPYEPGALSRMLSNLDLKRLSKEDTAALKQVLPDFIANESLRTVNLLKAAAQIKTLRELETELRSALSEGRSESWWQTYIKERILLIQQGYIQAIDKLNVAIGITKFPDFALVTHDEYLDILEIKRPDTALIKKDESRGNFYWEPEMAKAISQTENYIDAVNKQSNALRSHLKDHHSLDLQVTRPRGIILAGNAQKFVDQKQKDDFRLLCDGLKNIDIVTYDELLVRLSNYISALEAHVPKKMREQSDPSKAQ